MNKFIARAAAILSLGILSASVAVAAPGDKDKKKEAPKCPKCKMELVTKAVKGKQDVPVKIGKKTYFCCAACGAHEKMDKKKK